MVAMVNTRKNEKQDEIVHTDIDAQSAATAACSGHTNLHIRFETCQQHVRAHLILRQRQRLPYTRSGLVHIVHGALGSRVADRWRSARAPRC